MSILNNTEEAFFFVDEEQELLPSLSRWMKWGGLLIVVTVGVTTILSSVFKYNVSVQAPAIIRPDGELRLVQPGIEGQVKQIFVKANQQVKAGDILVSLDDTRLQIQKSQLEARLQQSQLQLSQIKAQIRAQDAEIVAETEKSNRAIVSAQAQLSRSRRDYRDRQITSQADVEAAQAKVNSAREKLQQTQAELKAFEANLRSLQASFNAATVKRDRYKTVAEQGALALDQLEEAQLAVNQQTEALAAQKATNQAQQKLIAQHQQDLTAAIANLQRVQAFLKPDAAEVTIATEKISQEKATISSLLANLTKERNALIEQQIGLQKQIKIDFKELQKLTFDLQHTLIKAPVDGIILKINLRNPGQTVTTNSEIAQIAPSNTPLIIKALVTPQDVSKVKPGQKAQFKVSACPYPDYGTLTSKVRQISPDAIPVDNYNAVSPTTTNNIDRTVYEVTIEPETLALKQGVNQCMMQLGMAGRVEIISKQETILQNLLRKARLLTDL
ncbi:HlyD family type I secretion periplasmic adaptor subunit [Chlorogloeopsis fritschii PCC 6912]|uniref:HlyD family type I secretion periplasmic adaptor subunit n=1 Tax=Chlorogloeopsis fritschii PCC 6912 TaxID=211165 RepID=A0A3S0XNS7_CHLFR|nr:HlyD family type I secretion periplasmic adaptor subunit [Chlorogloeopsis fritschii PCC 6912]